MADDFDFEGDFGSLDNMPSTPKKKGGAFKNLAAGIVVGAAKQMENYIPAVKETRESAADMASQMRDQGAAVKAGASKANAYLKGVTDDVKKIATDIRSTKGLHNKLNAASKGFNSAKKNLAYSIDPDAASSFDFDAMMGDDGSSGSHNDRSANKSQKLGGSRPGSSKGGKRPASVTQIYSTKITGGTDVVLRDVVIESAASIISSQAKIFKQATIINTKQHLEKMEVLNRIADTSLMMQRFNAEMMGPLMKQSTEYFNKFNAHLTDITSLLMPENGHGGGGSPFQKMFGGSLAKFGKKSVLDFVSASGGMDLGALYSHATGRLKDEADGKGLGLLSSMKDMLPMMLMGGGGGKDGMKSLGEMIGKGLMMPFKGKAMKISDQLSELIPASMVKMNESMGKSNNPALRGIAELLNLDTGTKGTVQLGTKNRRVQFDMVTRRSIVEVIPGYLSKILTAVGGGEELHFDHQAGTFTTANAMKRRQNQEIDSAGLGSMSIAKYNISSKANTKDKEAFGKDVDVIFKNLMMSGESFDPKNITAEKYKALTKGTKNPDSWNVFLDAFDRMPAKDKANVQTSLYRARRARREELGAKEVSLMEYGVGSLIGSSNTDAQISDLESKKHNLKAISGGDSAINAKGSGLYTRRMQENIELDKQIAQLKSVQSAQGNTSSGMNAKIYELLLGGIYVFPKRGIPSHIKKIHGDRAEEAKAAKASEANQKKNDVEYAKMLQESQLMQANDVLDQRDIKRLTPLQRLKMMFNVSADGKTGMLANMPGGKNILGMLGKIENNSLVKGLGRAKGKIDSKFDAFSGGLDNIGAEGGIDVVGGVSSLRKKASAVKSKFMSRVDSEVEKLKKVQAESPERLEQAYEKFKKSVVDSKLGQQHQVSDRLSTFSASIESSIAMARASSTSAVNSAKSKVGGAVGVIQEAITGKLSKSDRKRVNTTAPKQMTDKISLDSFSKGTKSMLRKASDGSLGLIGSMKVWMQGTMEKMNSSIFGVKENAKDQRQGLIPTIAGKIQSLTSTVLDFLVGNKEGKKPGILLKLAGPARTLLENLRHDLTSKLAIPFTQIGKSVATQMKWVARDTGIKIKNLGKDILTGVDSFMAKRRAKLDKINADRAAKGKKPKKDLIGNVFALAGGVEKLGGNVIGGVSGALYKRQDKAMQKMVAEGKISSESYEQWKNEYSEKQDSELKRHNESMSNIKSFEDKISTNRIKDEKLKGEYAGFEGEIGELMNKNKNMSREDRIADEKRAKAKAKENMAKLKRGEKLSKEDEYGALSSEQLVYRKRDDMNSKLDAEYKRQEATRAKEEFEMAEKRTTLTEKIHESLDAVKEFMISGKKPKRAPAGKGKKKGGAAAGIASGVGIDLTSGLREGSFFDSKEDKVENATIKMAKHIEQIASNTETTADAFEKKGLFSKFLDKFKGGGGDGDGDSGGFRGKLKKLGKFAKGGAQLAGGLALVGVGSAAIGATARKGSQVFSRAKEGYERGGVREAALTGVGEATGLDGSGDSEFRADGSRKGGIERAADNFKATRFVAHGGLQKAAKLIQVGGKMSMKGAKNMITSTKLGAAAGKVATGLVPKLQKMLTAMLSIKALRKFLSPDKVASLVASLSKSIGQKLGKSMAGKALKFLAGPIGMAVMAAADLGSGMAEAKRYFKIGKGDKATLGMRLTAGICKMINNGLLLGLLPMDWLAQTIYGFVASDEDKKNLSEKQDAMKERAAMLGVDPDKFNEWENKTVGSKFVDLFRSDKSKDARDAKLLGFDSVEEYKVFKEKYDAQNKDAKDKKDNHPTVQEQASQKMGIQTDAGKDIAEFGAIDGGMAGGELESKIATQAAINRGTIDSGIAAQMARNGVIPQEMVDEIRMVEAGQLPGLSDATKQKLSALGFATTVAGAASSVAIAKAVAVPPKMSDTVTVNSPVNRAAAVQNTSMASRVTAVPAGYNVSANMQPASTAAVAASAGRGGVILHPSKTQTEKNAESQTDPMLEHLKKANDQMGGAFDMKKFMEHETQLNSLLRTDNSQIISLLSELLAIKKKEYKEEKPLREYYKKAAGNPLMNAASDNALVNWFKGAFGGKQPTDPTTTGTVTSSESPSDGYANGST